MSPPSKKCTEVNCHYHADKAKKDTTHRHKNSMDMPLRNLRSQSYKSLKWSTPGS